MDEEEILRKVGRKPATIRHVHDAFSAMTEHSGAAFERIGARLRALEQAAGIASPATKARKPHARFSYATKAWQIGDTQQHSGGVYRFDGSSWVLVR